MFTFLSLTPACGMAVFNFSFSIFTGKLSARRSGPRLGAKGVSKNLFKVSGRVKAIDELHN
jgi:hypothetical protein